MDPIHVPGAKISLGSMVPSGVDAAAGPPKSCLLASKPLVAKYDNATTAFYHIKDPDVSREMSIQVSLFVPSPPLVYYVSVWSTDGCFTEEPFIHSTHGELILLSMAIRTKTCLFPEFYIYRPDARSLDLVPQFMDERFVTEPCAVGLLSPGDGGGYSVVVLTSEGEGEFKLCLFCSKMGTWSIKKPLLLLEDGAADFMPNKVITVDGGVLAFVDLSKGVLIGDVLQGIPEFHYIPFPSEFCRPLTSYPLHTRDVSINKSCDNKFLIKFVELFCPITLGAWAAATWITTTEASSPWNQLEEWDTHSILEARQLLVGDGVSIAELLPETLDIQCKPNFGLLFVDMPMLSLHEDNTVCFLAKHHYLEQQVWVIAVDMVTRKLLGVHPLQMERFPRLFYSTISSHLNTSATASGANGDLETARNAPRVKSLQEQSAAATSSHAVHRRL